MNRAFLVFHRWLALITALVIIVVALSGAAVVFEGPIARAHAARVTPVGDLLSLDTLAARAVASAGGGSVIVIGIGDGADLAYHVQVASAGAMREVTVNPYTGATLPTAAPSRSERLVREAHVLHTSLFAGEAGKLVVGFIALSGLLLVISGLVIWWREKLWRINWSASWKRIVFDLHHALGVFAAVVLLIVTATGVSINQAPRIDPILLQLNRTAPPSGPVRQPAVDSGSVPIAIDSIARIARTAMPGAAIMLMQLPPNGPAHLIMRYAEDHTPAGRSGLYIDRHGGTILRQASTRTAEPGTRLINLKRSLHTGDVFGGPTQAIWFLASLILAAQAVTGTLMWWNGRAGRKRRAVA